MERKNTAFYTLLYYITISGMLFIAGSAFGAGINEKHNYYDRWRDVPTPVLMSHAHEFINSGKDIDSALIYYNVVYNRYVDDPSDREKARRAAMALNNMGYMMSFDYYDYERAYSYLAESLELSQKVDCKESLPYVYVNLGNLILTQRSYVNPQGMKDALPYYRKGLHIAADLKDWDILLINFSNILGMANSLDSIIDFKDIASDIRFFESLHVPDSIAMLPYAIQDINVYKAMASGRYADAVRLGDKALAAIPPNPDSLRYVLNTRTEQAACFMRLGLYQNAVDILNRQLLSAKDEGIKDLESEIYLDLMIVYQKMGDRRQAEHYEYLYLKSKDDMLFGSHNIANVERSNLMRKLSKANNEVREGVRNRRRNMAIALVAIAFALTVSVFSIALLRRNKRLRESYHKLYLQVQEAVSKEDKYKNSNLDDKRREEIVGKIEGVFADKAELCSENMSLTRLSELINAPYKLVSQAINEHWQKNFSQLLSEYRIHEACRRMQDKAAYGNYTIEAIGSSVGFHTRSNFVTTFKRITGLTPSEYIREAQ